MPTSAPTIENLDAVNTRLDTASAPEVVQWAVDTFGDGLVLSTSFGVQAAVMLHLVTRVKANIPVIFIDTGYHFAKTYGFADALSQRLDLKSQGVFVAPNVGVV